MRKTHTHFEQVPVEVVEKILEEQNLPAKPDSDLKLVAGKSGRTANVRHTRTKKVGVSTP